jgi:hypothetical protein
MWGADLAVQALAAVARSPVADARAILFIEIAMVIFLVIFLAIVLRVALRRRGAYRRAARLPLENGVPPQEPTS